MLSGCFCPTGTEETDSQVNFGLYKKIHQEKNIDDARVTQDEVIVKHGLKKWRHFNFL
jgi:hypothetical protein